MLRTLVRAMANPATVPRYLYRDQWLGVIDKPAGLVVHSAPSHQGETLVDLLAGDLVGGDDPSRPGIVHRLDKDTSGAMVVSLSDDVTDELQALIRNRSLKRRYMALVSGSPDSNSGTIEAPIGRSTRDRYKMTVGGAAQRSAVTHFRVVERLASATLVEVDLDTGRTHQIRVHMAAIGHPVVGDSVYGNGPLGELTRQFLHSSEIDFPHPRTGKPVQVSSMLPEDLDDYLSIARGTSDR